LPAGDARPVLGRLAREFQSTLELPEVHRKLAQLGFEVMATDGAGADRHARQEFERWSASVRTRLAQAGRMMTEPDASFRSLFILGLDRPGDRGRRPGPDPRRLSGAGVLRDSRRRTRRAKLPQRAGGVRRWRLPRVDRLARAGTDRTLVEYPGAGRRGIRGLCSAARDAAAALREARARGLQTLAGPVDGGRLRPDGQRLQWQSVRRATPDLPFLCGDVTPAGPCVFPRGGEDASRRRTGVLEVHVAVRDLAATLDRYRRLLGGDARLASVDPSDAGRPVDAVLPGLADGAAGAVVQIASTRLLLWGPERDLPADHPLRERLARRGEGPVWLRLRGPHGPVERLLPPDLTHGAAISIAPAA
jgi:hypothetical protein